MWTEQSEAITHTELLQLLSVRWRCGEGWTDDRPDRDGPDLDTSTRLGRPDGDCPPDHDLDTVTGARCRPTSRIRRRRAVIEKQMARRNATLWRNHRSARGDRIPGTYVWRHNYVRVLQLALRLSSSVRDARVTSFSRCVVVISGSLAL